MKQNILEYLEKSTAIFGEKTAVTDGSQSYTYRKLLDLSQRIGSALSYKVKSRDVIAVLAEKSSDVVAIFLGIAQAGAFYVLLNPDLPVNRLSQIENVLEPNFIITDEEHLSIAVKLVDESHILMINDLKKADVNEERLLYIRSRMIDCDPLYANFTSGSTGTPKGVIISHRSVLDFIDNFSELFGINSSDVIANQAPFDFDVSVKDIYTSLKTGATLLIVPRALFSRPAQLLDFLCEHKVTTMIWAVSALLLISTCHGLDYRTPVSVKRVLFSGEVMPLKHLNAWMRHLPDSLFVNLYGPTEITCNCTYHIIDRNRNYENGIPIGKPFPNEQVFLLNGDNLVTTTGVIGEICVRGTALALGYLRNPEQTDAAFVQNPLNTSYPEKIYRTGDLGIYTENGEILFQGRKDFQVKYMGHRIELEEVEKTINGIEGIDRCCVVFDESKQRLHGFYSGNIEKSDLHRQLRSLLPLYMIPGSLKKMDAFPITKNGKTDRRALLEEYSR